VKKFEITEAQLTAIVYLTDTISAMIGCGDPDFDGQGEKAVKAVDRMLKKNGYKRKYN